MRVQVPPLAHDAAGWKLFDALPLVDWFVVQMPALEGSLAYRPNRPPLRRGRYNISVLKDDVLYLKEKNKQDCRLMSL
ncbi:MAG: hypothetical protein VXU46_04305 [Planctomycetota bacterium]|nr:hypothetical protein [Planctomycetota bacterium]